MDSVFAAVSEYYGVDQAIFGSRDNAHVARAMAAWLGRVRHIERVEHSVGLGATGKRLQSQPPD